MIMNRRGFLRITSAGTLALIPPSPAYAQAKKLGKIEYGLASLDPIYSAAYIAHKKGLFAEEGLEVEVLNSQSGLKADAGGWSALRDDYRLQRRHCVDPCRKGVDPGPRL